MSELTSTSHKSNLARERSRCQAEGAGDSIVLPLLRSRGRCLGGGLADAALPSSGRRVWEVKGFFCPGWRHLGSMLGNLFGAEVGGG